MDLCKKLKEIRTSKGLTQKQLAELLGVSTITIQNYENARRSPNIKIIKRIAAALNVSPHELLGESAVMTGMIMEGYIPTVSTEDSFYNFQIDRLIDDIIKKNGYEININDSDYEILRSYIKQDIENRIQIYIDIKSSIIDNSDNKGDSNG